jgi:predicted house-cleaning noncanonical NTP pyrophosphatase (MazG superfamily)
MGHIYRKLVRDKIPERIKARGDKPIWKTVEGADFRHALLMKVIEEASELIRNPGPEEEADLQEVLLKVREVYGYDTEDVEKFRLQKAETHGTFEDGIYLEYVEQGSSRTLDRE